MKILPYTFSYTPENLYAFHYVFGSDWLTLAIVIAIIIAYGCTYIISPYAYGYVYLRGKEQTKQDKRQVLKDLILMKEIQGELEKEMEQALLNNAMLSDAHSAS